MKKLISICLAAALLAGCLVGCGRTEGPANNPSTPNGSSAGGGEGLGDPQSFKFGLTVANTHPYSVAAQNFAKLVEEKSGGNMKVDLFYDGALGDDAALIESMQMNAVTFALVGPAGIAPMCPIYGFFDLPCLFQTRDAAYAFQESDAVWELMSSLSTNGIRGLGFYENGYYSISNNGKEITTVDGLNNLKLRSMTSDMAIKSWECLKVQPVAMPFGELFMAMQTGTVDGQETTIGSFYTSKFYEVQKYLTMANRIYHTMTFLMSDTAWNSLTEAQQNILLDAVNESKLAHKDYMTTYNEDAIKDMVDNHGLVVSELADGEFEKMREMCQSVYELVRGYDEDMYDKLIAAAEEANAAFPAE